MNNNNPLAEIGLLVLSVAILAAMTVLLVVGKINYIEALNFLIVVAGLFGVNVAAKAPSPAQQAQLQQLTSQALSTLPAVVAATQQPAPPQTFTPAPTNGFTEAQRGALAQAATQQLVPTPVQLAPGALATTTTVQPQIQFMPPYTPPDPKSMMAWSTQTEIPAVTIVDQATQRVAVPPTP